MTEVSLEVVVKRFGATVALVAGVIALIAVSSSVRSAEAPTATELVNPKAAGFSVSVSRSDSAVTFRNDSVTLKWSDCVAAVGAYFDPKRFSLGPLKAHTVSYGALRNGQGNLMPWGERLLAATLSCRDWNGEVRDVVGKVD